MWFQKCLIMRQHSINVLECVMQDTYKALYIYCTIDFSIVLWRDMEKLQVYLCQSNTRLAIFLHFVQVSKMSFVLSVLFFPSRGVVSIRPQFLMILKNKLVSGSKNSFAFSTSWGDYWPVFFVDIKNCLDLGSTKSFAFSTSGWVE